MTRRMSDFHVRKALGYALHFSPLSVTNQYTAESDGCSHCPRSCLNLWHQSRTIHCPLLKKKITDLYFSQKRSIGLFRIDITYLKVEKTNGQIGHNSVLFKILLSRVMFIFTCLE